MTYNYQIYHIVTFLSGYGTRSLTKSCAESLIILMLQATFGVIIQALMTGKVFCSVICHEFSPFVHDPVDNLVPCRFNIRKVSKASEESTDGHVQQESLYLQEKRESGSSDSSW